MDYKQNVLKSLIEDTENENYEDFIGKLRDKKSEELLEELIQLRPDEEGGRIALTGFYYQFLVCLDYWTQMLKGEWDFIALELHEDIVVGKGNKLRFIQVKSSKETEKSSSGTVYKRSKIKDKDTKAIVSEINDSWLDKIIGKARNFKKQDGYETEFELVTSFVIIDSVGKPIKKYKTEKFPKNVNRNDYLVKFMKEEKLKDRDNNKVCYEEESGEDIISLLSRFHIRKKPDLAEVKYYEKYILMDLNEKLGEGAGLKQEDLMMLVGRLMKMCNLYEEKLMLYISETESNELLQILEDKANKRAENRSITKGSITIIDEVFANLTQQLSHMDLYLEVQRYISAYKEYLVDWINNGGTIRELINRYLDGDRYSSAFKIEHIDGQKERLLDLFTVNLLLILAYGNISKFSVEYQSMLVKEIENKQFGFLSLNRGDKIEKAIEKAEYLLRNYEDIRFLLNPPKTIVQGKFANNRSAPMQKELNKTDIEIKGLEDDFKLDDVNIVLHIIPGGVFDDEFNNLFGFNDMEELKGHLNSLWGGLL
ncbi:TPA: DUF4297 domain-containing protein [Bacillus cereus]|nr:DUF4297 domain-containing protein [Bacillus cereus]